MRALIRKLGIGRILRGISKKEAAELHFQFQWAQEFPRARDKVEEYWREYRHLGRILEETGLDDRSKVLDVGCGISTVLHFLPGDRQGIDPLGKHYNRLYAYPAGISVQKGQGEKIPFADAHFDAVFCTNVLDHVTSPERSVAEIARVLKPGGHFLLTVELHDHHEERDEAHPHSLGAEDVERLTAPHFASTVFQESSPWVGLRRYAAGQTSHEHEELITLFRK